MYRDSVPLDLVQMFRAITLMEVAQFLGRELSPRQEHFMFVLAERTINKHLFNEDFRLFPILQRP